MFANAATTIARALGYGSVHRRRLPKPAIASMFANPAITVARALDYSSVHRRRPLKPAIASMFANAAITTVRALGYSSVHRRVTCYSSYPTASRIDTCVSRRFYTGRSALHRCWCGCWCVVLAAAN